MKKVLKIVLGVLGFCYLAVIIFATICLLCYNKYKVTQMGDKTFIIIDDKSDMYEDGDLVIFNKNSDDEILVGDTIFFYTVKNGEASVNSGTVTKVDKLSDTETNFVINNDVTRVSEEVIGKTDTATVHHNIGKILYIFESQYGFLALVVFPALLLFFYAIYRTVKEFKAGKEETEVPKAEVKEPVVTVKEEATPVIEAVAPAVEETKTPEVEAQPALETPVVEDVAPAVEETKTPEVEAQPVLETPVVETVAPVVEEVKASEAAPVETVVTEEPKEVSVVAPVETVDENASKPEVTDSTSNDDIEYL